MSTMIQRTLFVAVLLVGTVGATLATQLHWVGTGTGNGRFWDKTANWSLTQGGAGGAGVPTASDDVFIDGGGDLQINTTAVCRSFTQSFTSGAKGFLNNATLTVGTGGFTISGGAMSITTTGNSIAVAGNWTQTGGSFTQGTATVTLNGTSAQTVTGTTSFVTLTVNNAAGVTLAQNDTVTTSLTLTSGAVSTGASKLVIPTGATLTRTGGWVNGNLQMPVATGATSVTFHSGDASNYTPVTVAFASVTTAGNLTAKSTGGDHPNVVGSPINSLKSVNRYYTLTNGGVVFTTYSATFNFVAGDVDAGANTANFIVGKYNTPTWTQPTVGTKTATSTQATGLSSFSDFVIGEPVALTITASAGANGTISPSGSVPVSYNGSQGFTITANANYHIADVLVDGVSQGPVASYSFTSVVVNHTISASFLADTVAVTATAGAGGSISPSGITKVASGGGVSYTITPDVNYHISDVLVNGGSVGAVAGYNFTNLLVDQTIAASFAVNVDTITATAGANGSISPSGTVTVNAGSDQGFTITPSTGYHVADVLVDGSSIGGVAKYTFPGVTANHTIAATFAIDTLTITASSGANGSISPSGAVAVLYGSDQGFTVTPSTGYHVADVTVDGSSIGAVAKYTFPGVTVNHTISASFAIDTLTVSATAGANGSISPSGSVAVLYGSDQGFTITPDAGFHVLDVTVDGSSIGAAAKYTFTNVTANHTIAATFSANQFVILATADVHGTISPSGAVLVDSGANQSFTITPDTGYYVADVRVDSVSVGVAAKYTFTNVTGAHVIEASFALQSFVVKAIADAHGSISPSGQVPVSYGSDQSFTVTPDTGYLIADVHVDSVSVGPVAKYTFTNVTATHVIEASFQAQAFTIAAVAGPHGTISPSGSVPEVFGGSQVFTITPDSAYFVSDVHVDSVSVGAVTKYTFPNISANHTIEAFFDTYPVPILKTVSPSSAYRGQTVDLVLTGTNFVNGASSLNAGAGISVKTFTVHSSDSIFATVTVGASAVRGTYGFTITNTPPGGGTSGAVTFTVLNHAPAPVLLASPGATDTIRLKAPPVPVDFSWHPSSDPDGGDTLTYLVRVLSPLLDTIAVTTDTSVSAAGLMALLLPQTDYTWSVEVTDGYDTVASADTLSFRTSDSVSAVTERGKRVPTEYALHQNYPNPFNPSTQIQFDLPHASVVTLKVFNLLGQEIATLVDHSSMEAGYQTVRFDASRMPSGVYLYRISADGTGKNTYVSVKKMMLLR